MIVNTPSSKLVRKPTRTQQKKQKKEVMTELKNIIEKEMKKTGDSIVLQNRLSWSKFDNNRKQEGLVTPCRKRISDSETPPSKRKKKHGMSRENLPIDKDKLLEEAKQWETNTLINWSKLGTKYRLTVPNRGQILKEFLSSRNIPCASEQQRLCRTSRRVKKRLPNSNVSFPMHDPIKKQKQKVKHKIDSGEIQVGEKIVPTEYMTYARNEQANSISKITKQVFARKITIEHIREKIL